MRSRTMVPGTMSSLAVASTVSRSATGSMGLIFVADAAVPPKEHVTATTSARIRVVMILLRGHADELTVGPPTSGYGTILSAFGAKRTWRDCPRRIERLLMTR